MNAGPETNPPPTHPPAAASPGTDRSGVRVLPPAVYAAALLLGFLVQWLAPQHIVPDVLRAALAWAGLLFVAAAIVLALWARREFVAAGTAVHPWHPATALVTGGPFRWSRNPMYVALTMLSIGVAFLFNALWPLLLVVPAVLVLRQAVILREETYLERRFGPAYREYKKRVRRWL